jgi:hypothetical protein
MSPKPPGSAPDSPESKATAVPSPPRSPTHKPKSSRNASISSIGRKDHTPLQPSGLRRSARPGESPSPDGRRTMGSFASTGKRPSVPGIEEDGGREDTEGGESDEHPHAETTSFWSQQANEPNIMTRLLQKDTWGFGDGANSSRPTSPRQGSFMSYHTFRTDLSDDGFGGPYPGGTGAGINEAADATHGLLGDTIADGLLGGGDGNKMSTTNHLAKRHGIHANRKM